MRIAAGLLPLFLSATLALAQATQPASPPNQFDPARHMRVSEVKPGMKGYGLSVFYGSKIDRFDVEVLSILHNFNPKYDVILVRCAGANLEHTGGIAGMSGSPIYLTDEQGRSRMVGAFAYGWPLAKDPVGGVQPIEYMLQLPDSKPDGSDGSVTQAPDTGAQPAQRNSPWSLNNAIPLQRYAAALAAGSRAATWDLSTGNWELNTTPTSLRPLATPLMASGISPQLLNELAPIFRTHGMEILQSGGSGGGSSSTRPTDDIALEPGSALAVPLMTGDLNLTAIGTCTEVLGNRVYGFGHAMNNEGAVNLPMGSGKINGIIANLATSFKIGELTNLRGSLNADQTVGIAGHLGPVAPTIPVDLRLLYTDGSVDRTCHFNISLHPRLTPLLASVAVGATLTGGRELPQYNTLDYDLNLVFESGQSIPLKDTLVDTSAAQVFFVLGLPLMAASENPFQRVPIQKVTGTLKVSTGSRSASILSVNVPKLTYKPGETLKAFVTYRPFRRPEAILPVDVELPKDLTDGSYQLLLSGWERYLADEEQTKPFRFTAQSAKDIFDALRDVASVKHTNLFVRLLRQPDGVAIGRTAMPALPSSRRQVLLEAGRSDTTPFISSTTKTIATQWVLDGDAAFQIEISHDGHPKKSEPKGVILPVSPRNPDPSMPAGGGRRSPPNPNGPG